MTERHVMPGTLPPGGGSSMPPSNQVKKVVPNGANIYGKQNTPPTVTGQPHPAPGALLPAGSPRIPPTTGRPRKPAPGN